MPSMPTEDLPPLDPSLLSETGTRAYDFLRNVTKLMGVDVEIRMKEDEGHLYAQMTGDALGGAHRPPRRDAGRAAVPDQPRGQ
jgi:hypothetical protein